MDQYLNQHEYNPYSNDPQDMRHYWHAFLCTDECSNSVLDDWNMYCMGHQL